MSQPDEFLDRFNEPPDQEPYDPYGIDRLRALSDADLRSWVRRYEAALTAGPHPAIPASRPASTPGASAGLTTESPGPAEVSGRQIDLFGRLNAR